MDKYDVLSATDFEMKTAHHTYEQQLRRDARARVRGGLTGVAASRVVVMTTPATLFTAKINPCWASGGLPREGNP